MQKYRPVITTKFKKDLKRAKRRGLDLDLLKDVVLKLSEGKKLPAANRDHPLVGNFIGYRECHIQPDWLLIYKIDEVVEILSLERTGSHSDIL